MQRRDDRPVLVRIVLVSDRKTISPRRAHSASTAQIISLKYGLEIAEIARPTVPVEASFSERAKVFGVYPTAATTSLTRWTFSGET